MKDIFEIIPVHGFVIPHDWKPRKAGRKQDQRNPDSDLKDAIIARGKALMIEGKSVIEVANLIETSYYPNKVGYPERDRRLRYLRSRLSK